MPLSDFDVHRISSAVAEKAMQQWASRAVPPGVMSRQEMHDMIEDGCKTANEQMLVQVREIVREMFNSIGLDLAEPAETATRIKTLFRLQHNIGVVVLWTCIAAIGAIVTGIGWAISAPWRK